MNNVKLVLEVDEGDWNDYVIWGGDVIMVILKVLDLNMGFCSLNFCLSLESM